MNILKRGWKRLQKKSLIKRAKAELAQLQSQMWNISKREGKKPQDDTLADFLERQKLVDGMTNWQRQQYSCALAENGGPISTDRIIAFTKMKRITYG